MDMKIEKLKSRSMPVPGNDIDTDQIIPARFMKCVSFNGLGEYAFYDVRYDGAGKSKNHPLDDKTFEGSEIMLVNKNFGCGSSREHAPQALQKYGINGIVGESFAEIFAGNCTMMGIPAVKVSEADIKKLMELANADPSSELEIDLLNKKVTLSGNSFDCDMPESYRKTLVDGTWDSTALLLGNIKQVEGMNSSLPY